jgi:hypothetical protein
MNQWHVCTHMSRLGEIRPRPPKTQEDSRENNNRSFTRSGCVCHRLHGVFWMCRFNVQRTVCSNRMQIICAVKFAAYLCCGTPICTPMEICIRFLCAFLLRCTTSNLLIESLSAKCKRRLIEILLPIEYAFECNRRFAAHRDYISKTQV